MPQDKLRAWQEEKAIWLKLHPQPWSEKTADEYVERFVERIQKWLDAGYGSCALQEADARQVVENALRHFDGERYTLDEFVLMPNHVHLLVQPMPGFSFVEHPAFLEILHRESTQPETGPVRRILVG